MLVPFNGYIVNKNHCEDILHTPDESLPGDKNNYPGGFYYGQVMETSDQKSHVLSYFNEAEAQGIFHHTKKPAYYGYRQTFMHEGQLTVRLSIIANIDMAEAAYNIIPHERTFSTYVQKKTAFLQQKFNVYPVTCFFTGKSSSVRSAIEEVSWTHVFYKDDEVKHEFGQIPDKYTEQLRKQTHDHLFLADGHHRYEAMKQLHKANPTEYRYLLGCIMIPQTDYPMQPIHRMVKLKEAIDPKRIEVLLKPLKNDFFVTSGKSGKPSLSIDKYQLLLKGHLITLHGKEKNIAYLLEKTEKYIFGKLFENNLLYVHYNPQTSACIKSITNGDYEIMLSPPIFDLQQLITICKSGKWLPEKTTYLFPKIPGGFLAGKVDNND